MENLRLIHENFDGMGIDNPKVQTPARVRWVNKESQCVNQFQWVS
jgi:hypothetical protein